METPLVSILIPCFNASRWLATTLDSVFAQTWPNLEVILVDDGSSDDSLTVARRYESRGLRVFTQPNRGQCAAANRALAASRGAYVKFLDADDLINPVMIERQIHALAGSISHLAHAEWSRFVHQPEEADFSPRSCWHDADPIDWIAESWTGGQPMHQCGIFLIPRPLLERTGGWDESLSLINDFEFFARLITASDGIRFSPGARLYYRSGISGSLSTQKSRRAWESAFQSLNGAVDHLLRREDSPRTRLAGADCLMELVGAMYPHQLDLVRQLETRIHQLGGSAVRPSGGRVFKCIRATVGWKMARRAQETLRGRR